VTKADVAELVDARDLKCLATPESPIFFGKRDPAFGINLLERSEIWKTFLEASFGGLQWPYSRHVVAAMRAAPALLLHCRPTRLDLRNLQSRLEEAAKLAIETSTSQLSSDVHPDLQEVPPWCRERIAAMELPPSLHLLHRFVGVALLSIRGADFMM
jgi:hypothetical protein